MSTDVLFQQEPGKGGDLGIITLNRPKSLNALTQEMCLALDQQLAAWAEDENIKAVVIQGAGDRAFCAGGDIVELYQMGQAGDYEGVRQFFYHEYRLNHRIHTYSKPYIAFLDGITMGGGVGVSIHGSHRIATERFHFAMPETGIGFFPDIGASFFLPRCPGETGVFLGLTGLKVNPADAYYMGLVNHIIARSQLDEIKHGLCELRFGDDPKQAVSEFLSAFSIQSEMPEMATHREMIDDYFSRDSVEEIFQALQQSPSDWARDKIYPLLKTKSPTSLKVSLEAFRRGISSEFISCMEMEFCLSQHFIYSRDFYEGVRALLIDKDKNPQWIPKIIQEVSAPSVDDYFATTQHLDLS